MPKVTLELEIKEAKDLIEQMPLEDKVRLVRELEKETWAKRLDKIIKNIDERRKKYKISNKGISQEIEKARHEYYARRH